MIGFLRDRPLMWPVLLYYVVGYFATIPDAGDSAGVATHYWAAVAGALATAAIRVPLVKSRTDASSDRHQDFEILAILLLLPAVVVALIAADWSEFRIQRGVIRQASIWYQLINLNVLVGWLAAYLVFAPPNPVLRRHRAVYLLLVAVALILSVGIAFIEGRRTVAALPFAFLVLSYLASGRRVTLSAIVIIFAAGCFAIAVFAAVTSLRVEQQALVWDIVVRRVFWPAIALRDFFERGYGFEPDTLSQVAKALIGGFTSEGYQSKTEMFGLAAGYVDAAGLVRINLGVVLEAILYAGAPAFLLVLAALNLICWGALKLCKKMPANIHVLLLVLFLHGYQMEIPYTLAVIIKVVAVGACLLLLKLLVVESVLRKRRGASLRSPGSASGVD